MTTREKKQANWLCSAGSNFLVHESFKISILPGHSPCKFSQQLAFDTICKCQLIIHKYSDDSIQPYMRYKQFLSMHYQWFCMIYDFDIFVNKHDFKDKRLNGQKLCLIIMSVQN